jgi:hypothetical protein
LPHHGNDVYIAVHVNLIEELVRILLGVAVLKHPNELAALDEGNNLLEADAALADEPGILLRIKGVIPFFHSLRI